MSVYYGVALIGFAITFPYLLSRIMVLSFFFALGVAIKPIAEKDEIRGGGTSVFIGAPILVSV